MYISLDVTGELIYVNQTNTGNSLVENLFCNIPIILTTRKGHIMDFTKLGIWISSLLAFIAGLVILLTNLDKLKNVLYKNG